MEEDECCLDRGQGRRHCVGRVLWKWGFGFSSVRESWCQWQGLQVIALDFSKEQLHVAASRQQERTKPCYKNIEWVEGDATDLPFSHSSFDAATIGYGLRNIVDKKKSLQEMHRVLKPGSKLSVLDFNKSASQLISSIQDWMIDHVVVPVASGYGLADEYSYLKHSIKEFLTGDELEKLAKEAGFSEAKHYEIGTGFMGNLVAKR
ncbi:2-phytyl-1,4-beta-naphthoquinone methyltransferase, chloroplastic-like isoform X2 [Andrographis paniculata]|uniref:2-phytyl-1,4-beta-naphthoquinone methyltransferase, chloroplastic-like isoform X2 n=1 Tax=Andrographis paniculata TaxID=175694 RepID=UPI0021E89933|nr:2-phytyl-1,4-beta-naphthoquinone methyltransferase, chloroplastic-like isoform X2 [Andrographis paniculata]